MGKKSTYHSKNGKFTSYDRANIVNDGGQKFRMVRKLEPVDDKQGDGSLPPDASTAENVAKVKAKVNDLAARIAPQWLPLSEVVGEGDDSVISHGKTADGVKVLLWSNGMVTGAMGYQLRGVLMARAKAKAKRDVAVRAGQMLLGDVSLYDASELGAAYKAYRWAAEKHKDPGEARARFSGEGKPAAKGKLIPSWDVVSADRGGRPKERVWRLPRMRWPGLAVWDYGGKTRRGERYELVNVDRSNIARATGFFFKNMQELEKHLMGIK